MTQVLEYITQNYTWFLGGSILILLAIIGYYADKTNFGQGKTSDIKDEDSSKKSRNIQEIGLLDITSNSDNDENLQLINNENQESSESTINNEQAVINNANGKNTDNTELMEQTNSENMIVQEKVNSNVSNEKFVYDSDNILKNDGLPEKAELLNNDDVVVDVNLVKKSANVVLSEEAINSFNEEFELLLPKKELIDTDLLSDIDDLKLDKTQKLNLSNISEFEDIELPKIKHSGPIEQDVWKF